MYIKLIQIIILGFSLIGTSLVFFNSPFLNRQIYAYNNSEIPKIIKKDKRKRLLSIIGFGLIILSYLIQTIIILIET